MTGGEILGLVMLTVLIGVIFIGFPIAFTLLFLALVFGYVGLGGMVFDLMFFQTIGMMKEEVLAAVPGGEDPVTIFLKHSTDRLAVQADFHYWAYPIAGRAKTVLY